MKEYASDKIRNVVLLGHDGSGKTSFLEGLLYTAGATNRLGKVLEGTSIGDFEPEEVQRKVTINLALAACERHDMKFNFLDAPGYGDFVGEVFSGLRAADSGIVTLCATSGIQVETENSWRYLKEEKLPSLFFINKMDRENADFFKVLGEIQHQFGNRALPFQLPLGSEANFKGMIDLVSGKAYQVTDAAGLEYQEIPIPAEFEADVQTWRDGLMECAAESSEDWILKYLEGEELTEEELHSGLRAAIAERRLFPVFCGAMIKNIGGTQILNGIEKFLPQPGIKKMVGMNPTTEKEEIRKLDDSFSAFVFKTTTDPFVGRLNYVKILSGKLKGDTQVYNPKKDKMEKVNAIFTLKGKQQEPLVTVWAGDIAVLSKLQETVTGDTLCEKDHPIIYPPVASVKPMLVKALYAKKKGDEDKIGNALNRMTDEDPSLEVIKDIESGQLLIRGIGEQQLEIMVEKIKRKFGVEIVLGEATIPYRETIRGTAKVEGRHKKQTGGHGQYGHVWLYMEPLAEGSGLEFVDAVVGGAVPRSYIPAVEKGVHECVRRGALAGYPVVDIKVTLQDGSHHSVDSSEMAFKMATFLAFKKGMLEAKPVLLEPIYQIEVIVPESYMGDIVGDINSKRGRILGMESDENGHSTVRAQVPLSEIVNYPTELRSMTQGRGRFDRKFDHYEEVPARTAEKLIAEAQNKQTEH